MSDTSRCSTIEENLSDICLILCTKSKRLTEYEDAISIEPVYLPESVTSLTKVCLCIDRSGRARTQRTNPRRNRITSLVPNYAVMKINRYICRVLRLSCSFRHFREIILPLRFTLFPSARKGFSLPTGNFLIVFFGFRYATCLILSKVHSLSICLFRHFHASSLPIRKSATSTGFNFQLVVGSPRRCLA